MNTTSGPGLFIGYFTWAQLFALTGMVDGNEAIVTDIPNGGRRSRWYYDATAGRWRVYSPTILASSTTVVTGLAQAAAQYLTGLSTPMGILQGATFLYRVGMGKTGTTDALGTGTLRLGPLGAIGDPSIGTMALVNTLTSANRSAGFEIALRAASTTSIERLGTAAGTLTSFAGSANATAPNAASAVSDLTTNAMVIGISTTMGAAPVDSPQVTYQQLILQP